MQRKRGKEVKINFPEGRYDIYPDKAIERELYVSNTVGADQNNKIEEDRYFSGRYGSCYRRWKQLSVYVPW